MQSTGGIIGIIKTGLCIAVLVGIFAVILFFIQKKEDNAPKAPVATFVRTFTIGASSDTDTRSFPGFVKESCRAKVAFRVAGPICQLDIIIGQHVKKDDVLATIDTRDFELAIQRLESNLIEAQAMYKAMKTGARAEDVAALKSQLEAAKSAEQTASAQHDRMKNLLASGTAAQANYDEAKMKWDLAKGQREALEQQLEKATTGSRPEEITAMEAKIAGIETDLKLARNKLDDTTLKAPFNGIVVQKYVENHEIVAPGAPVVELSDANRLEISINIPESILIRENDFAADSFSCEFEAFPGHVFPAKLKEIGQSIQLGKQSYPLTLSVDVPADDSIIIRPGLAAVVHLSLKKGKSDFLIPLSCLVGEAGQKFSPRPNGQPGQQVQDVPDQNDPNAAIPGKNTQGTAQVMVFDPKTSTVSSRSVTFGKILPNDVEITSGLKRGDIIVQAGARFLDNGQKVQLAD